MLCTWCVCKNIYINFSFKCCKPTSTSKICLIEVHTHEKSPRPLEVFVLLAKKNVAHFRTWKDVYERVNT